MEEGNKGANNAGQDFVLWFSKTIPIVQGYKVKECDDYLKIVAALAATATGYGEQHDFKGIRLSWSDKFSKGNYNTVKLNWTQLQNRFYVEQVDTLLAVYNRKRQRGTVATIYYSQQIGREIVINCITRMI